MHRGRGPSSCHHHRHPSIFHFNSTPLAPVVFPIGSRSLWKPEWKKDENPRSQSVLLDCPDKKSQSACGFSKRKTHIFFFGVCRCSVRFVTLAIWEMGIGCGCVCMCVCPQFPSHSISAMYWAYSRWPAVSLLPYCVCRPMATDGIWDCSFPAVFFPSRRGAVTAVSQHYHP